MLTQTQATTEDGSEDTDRRAASSPQIRLLVIDDHPAVRFGLRQMLEDQPDFNVVGVVETAEDALAVAESHPIDIAIVDYQLGGRNGLWVSASSSGYGIRRAWCSTRRMQAGILRRASLGALPH
jgi:PleD family two-component response regulator